MDKLDKKLLVFMDINDRKYNSLNLNVTVKANKKVGPCVFFSEHLFRRLQNFSKVGHVYMRQLKSKIIFICLVSN